MKKNYLLNLVLLLISIFFINSCRQELTVYEEANLKRETDFFKNAETKINKIDGGIELLELLKSENEKTQFVSKLSDQKGIPVWDKIIIDKSVVQNKNGETTNEQRILIPLTEDDIFMSSYITVKINENGEVTELDNISNKKLYDIIHNTTISKEIRETIISNIIFTNYQTFGYKKFMNIPEDLFPDVPLDSGKTTKTIQLSSEENNSSSSNSIGSKQMQLVCFTYEVETCGSCGHYTTFTKCSYVYVDYGGGSGGDGGYGGTGNPGNGGGGGTGTGTGNNTPWYLMNPNIDIYTYNSNVRGVFKSLTDFNIVLEKEHLDYIQPKSALTNTLRNCLTNNTIYKSTFVYSLLEDYAFAYPTPDANILNNKLTSFYSTLFSINPKTNWLEFYKLFYINNVTLQQFQRWFVNPITHQDLIDELQGYPCAQSILGQLPNMSNDIALAMRNIFQNNKNYNIYFRAKSGLGNVDGETFSSFSKEFNTFRSVIYLNDIVLQNATKEYILITMYHEVIHAFLDYEKYRLGDSAFHDQYPGVLVGYDNDTNGRQINRYTFLPQHNQLGAFLSQLENILSNYNPNLPSATVKAIAKAGITTMTAQENQLNQNERNTVLNSYVGTKCP